MFIGVDGCKQGWVTVAVGEGGYLGADVFSDFAALVARHAQAFAIGVDMPIGLVASGSRDADASARAFLSGQASSVLSAPVASVLEAPDDYERALRLSRRDAGKRLSRQSFDIIGKIAEVEKCR